MNEHYDLLTGKDLEHAIANRKAARELAIDAAIAGDEICGGLFALESSHWLARHINELEDYNDDAEDDDDIRPY